MTDDAPAGLIHLRANGISLLLDTRSRQLPRIAHWGADLGDSAGSVEMLSLASAAQRVSNTPDVQPSLSLLPEQSRSWLGYPGIEGHRGGRHWSTMFETTGVECLSEHGVQSVVVRAEDAAAGLGLVLTIELMASGLVRMRGELTNLARDAYELQAMTLALPLPLEATEILDFGGRHLKERTPQRTSFGMGTHLREYRRGRTGADATLLLLAGEHGFSFRTGEVWAMHCAWSGNHRILAERGGTGEGILAAGELLLPGEVSLGPDESYTSPWIYASYGHGIDEVSGRIHAHLRSRPQHPRRPRPVTINVWEAVYFDQDLSVLTDLARLAASVGVERYVLDDGWFLGRRDPRTGLGDWYVDPDVWPEGLMPLIDVVHSHGMEFGLWVEPEMINPDSHLAREHPDWILGTGTRMPPPFRHQQVLDLANPEAFAHILERLGSLLAEYPIAYLKWDHNRDVFDAAQPATGRATVHDQTLAFYRLVDHLKERFPDVEIESCSSGGSRIDLGVLDRTDRIWASDCIDALERQTIHRWTGLLVPPEMMGAHVSSTENHSTGRVLSINFRAGTAFFHHFGIEWDLRTATADELDELAQWIALFKEHRALLHSGTVVHGDHPDPAISLSGVVAEDRAEAIFGITLVATSDWAPPGLIRLPGLDAETSYRIVLLPPTQETAGQMSDGPVAWSQEPLHLTGRALAAHGLQIPALHPERVVLLHLSATTATKES